MSGKHRAGKNDRMDAPSLTREPDLLGCARFVGRVGALAIALGIGGAIGGHGMAAAEEDGDSTSSSSVSSSESGNETDAEESEDTAETDDSDADPDSDDESTDSSQNAAERADARRARLAANARKTVEDTLRVIEDLSEAARDAVGALADVPDDARAGSGWRDTPEVAPPAAPSEPTEEPVHAAVSEDVPVQQLSAPAIENIAVAPTKPAVTRTVAVDEPVRVVLSTVLGAFGVVAGADNPEVPAVPNPLPDLLVAAYREVEQASTLDSVTQPATPVSLMSAAVTEDPATVTSVAVRGRSSAAVVSPDGDVLYVVDELNGTVTAINTSTGSTIGSPIKVGTQPRDIAISGDGTRVYVANYGSGTVSVIDTSNNTVVGTISGVDHPTALAVSKDGSTLYVAEHVPANVAVVDTATGTRVDDIAQTQEVYDLAISEDGSRLAVLGRSNVLNWLRITVVDTSTNDPITIMEMPLGTKSVAMSPDGKYVYAVVDVPGDEVHPAEGIWVLDAEADHQEGEEVRASAWIVIKDPVAVVVHPEGSGMYVLTATGETASLVMVDRTNNRVLQTMSVPVGEAGPGTVVAISPDGTRLYVPANGGKVVTDPTDPTDPGEPGGNAFTQIGAFAQLFADQIRAITGHQDTPRPPNAQNDQFERDWERNWDVFNLYIGSTLGWIPGVNLFMNSINLSMDIGQLINAIGETDPAKRDAAIRDELFDILATGIASFPGIGYAAKNVLIPAIATFLEHEL